MSLITKHNLFRFLIAASVLFLFSLMFWPFFIPLLLAALFAFALENWITKLTKKYKKRNLVTLVVLLGLALFVAIPLVFISLKTVSSIKDYSAGGFQNTLIYQQTETLLTKLSGNLKGIAENFNMDMSQLPQLNDLLGQVSSWLAQFITDTIAKIPQRTVSVFVFLGGIYFFLVEAAQIKKFILQFNLLTRSEVNQLIDIIKRSSYLTLFASAVVGCLQATIVASFGYFCGFTEFFILFILTFIASLIPIVGAAPIALFLSLLAYMQDHNGAMIGMIVATVIASSIDNVVKPLIVNSSNEDIHPLVSFLALIGAIFVYGAPGLLLGPILTQLALKIVPILFPTSANHEAEENESKVESVL